MRAALRGYLWEIAQLVRTKWMIAGQAVIYLGRITGKPSLIR
jgi:hypothetical protein